MGIARASKISGNDIAPGQQYGATVIPYSWEAMMEITSVSSTGDGATKKIVGYTPIESEHYGAYTGGQSTLSTHDPSATYTFSDIPSFISLSGYVKDSENQGIENVTVSDGTDSDDTSSSGYWWFFSSTVPYSGVLTPTKDGFEFSPATISLSNRYGSVYENNFIGSELTPEKPINPTPEHESEEVDWSDLTLSWEDGGKATSYDVYFGNTILFDEWVFLGNTEDTSIVVPYTITGDNVTEEVQAYAGDPLDWMHTQIDWNVPLFWRVDARNEQGTTEGDVWWFDARPVKTAAPTPENSYTNMTLDWMDFEWTGAPTATSYDTYIRTEEISFINLINSSVLNSIDQSDLINAVEVIFGKNTADYDTNYYWRVDSKNLFGVFEGDSWMFTTIPFLPPAMSKYWNGEEWKWSGENFISTEKKLVAAANNRIWLCDDV